MVLRPSVSTLPSKGTILLPDPWLSGLAWGVGHLVGWAMEKPVTSWISFAMCEVNSVESVVLTEAGRPWMRYIDHLLFAYIFFGRIGRDLRERGVSSARVAH